MTETNLPELNRLDWLDALRGWAVLGVVMVHSGQAAHSTGITQQISAAGQYGVQLFFLISAFDPPPLNWSTLRYVFGHEKEDRNAEKAPQA